MPQSSGQIIILNGTSSSGKSTIAKELQNFLAGYTLHTGIDHFVQMLPQDFVVLSDGTNPAAVEGLLWVTTNDGKRVTEFRFGPKAVQFKESMYRSAKAMAATGFNVIIDDVIMDERVLKIICQLMAGEAYFIGIHCSKEEALRRETERGDRFPGLVETQFDIVHRHGIYDLECDTLTNSAIECANLIQQLLLKESSPEALHSLMRTFSSND
jgi:chloramphenicol 3-O phosphotransferase